MSKLSDLYSRCRTVFLACDEFHSNDSLRAVFASSQLSGYSHKIPEANIRDQRVDFCLFFLRDKQLKEEPVLALFLEILGSRYPEDDNLHIELNKLAKEVRIELSGLQYTLLPTLSKIDVGIVLALKEEFIELLGELASTPTSSYDNELHTYYYHFQPVVTNKENIYRCVATFVGGMGATKTALVTEKLISKWKPDTLVLLGIAGSLDNDVMLGDIVVADQIDMYLENAKAVPAETGEGYAFQLSGEVYRGSHGLCVAANHFEIAYRELFSNWQEQCVGKLQQLLPSMKVAKTAIDRQYQQKPQVHIGHIASGSAVGASLAFKNWLKNQRDRKYLALEMEAGGFMTAIHERDDLQSLVLRAISDYGDEHKQRLDKTGKGVFRRYAVHNVVLLLQSFFEADLFRLTKKN